MDTKYLSLLKCFTGKIVKDLFLNSQLVAKPQDHLEAAIGWLKRAHDCSPDDGVSWGYSIKGGWRPSYRETSGYIVMTFFDLANQLGDTDARERAVTISEWLCRVQNADGSISDPRFGSSGIVFDTGQVLQGLVKAFEQTQETCFLNAAEKAADWLVKVADLNGIWTRNTHLSVPHVYNTRVAWSLLTLNALNARPEREKVARSNLDWALKQQRNGWFEHCAFTAKTVPFTHTIAYTIRGLLESGILLGENKYIDSAIWGAEVMLHQVCSDGFIPGLIDTNGQARSSYCCLTGNCQMAIIWLKLFEQFGDQRYLQAAVDSLRYLMSYQDISTTNLDIRGGIKGSQPIWGRYVPLGYPNWAAKFFIDAMSLLLKLLPNQKSVKV